MEAHPPPGLRHGADPRKSRGQAERRGHHRARCGHRAGRRRGPHRCRVSRQGYPGPPRNRPEAKLLGPSEPGGSSHREWPGSRDGVASDRPRRVHERPDSRGQARLSGCLHRCGAHPLRPRRRESAPSDQRTRGVAVPGRLETTGPHGRLQPPLLARPGERQLDREGHPRQARAPGPIERDRLQGELRAVRREAEGEARRMGCADEALRGDGDRQLPSELDVSGPTARSEDRGLYRAERAAAAQFHEPGQPA